MRYPPGIFECVGVLPKGRQASSLEVGRARETAAKASSGDTGYFVVDAQDVV